MSTKFAHIRPSITDNRQGGYTIAFAQNDLNGVVVYAVARCNPKDNFNKAKGRSIAAHRFDKGTGGIGGILKTRATKLKTIVNKLVSVIDEEIATERAQFEIKKPLKRKK